MARNKVQPPFSSSESHSRAFAGLVWVTVCVLAKNFFFIGFLCSFCSGFSPKEKGERKKESFSCLPVVGAYSEQTQFTVCGRRLMKCCLMLGGRGFWNDVEVGSLKIMAEKNVLIDLFRLMDDAVLILGEELPC